MKNIEYRGYTICIADAHTVTVWQNGKQISSFTIESQPAETLVDIVKRVIDEYAKAGGT